MVFRKIAGFSTAVLFVSISSIAQTNSPSPTKSKQADAKRGDTASTMTVTGCLVKEADYRSAHGLGKGALNGAGLGDEFVLVDTTESGAPASDSTANARSKTSGTAPSTSAASCTEKGAGPAYRLTGSKEK